MRPRPSTTQSPFRRTWWRADERFAEPGNRFPLGMRTANPRCWLCESCYRRIASEPFRVGEALFAADACVGKHSGSGLTPDEIWIVESIAAGDVIVAERFNTSPKQCQRILADQTSRALLGIPTVRQKTKQETTT